MINYNWQCTKTCRIQENTFLVEVTNSIKKGILLLLIKACEDISVKDSKTKFIKLSLFWMLSM